MWNCKGKCILFIFCAAFIVYKQILSCWEGCWISVATKEELINKSFFFICLETPTQFWQPPLCSFLHINGQLTQVIIKIIINIFNIISVDDCVVEMKKTRRNMAGQWMVLAANSFYLAIDPNMLVNTILFIYTITNIYIHPSLTDHASQQE